MNGLNLREQKNLRTRKWKNVNGTWVSSSDVAQPRTTRRNPRKQSPSLRELKNIRTRKWPSVQVVESTSPRRSVNIREQKKLRTRKWKNVNGTWVTDNNKVKRHRVKSRITSPSLIDLKKMTTRKWPSVQVVE
jgi:hypothetical protein